MKAFTLTKSGYYKPNQTDQSAISYPEEGNADCFQMEKHSQWFQARNKTILWALNRFPFKGDFLDVGGGNGYQISFLQQSDFKDKKIRSAMCEPGESGCINAANREVENVYCCFVEDFPFEEYHITGVGLFDVVEHIDDDVEFLKSIASRLPVGARIYITVPAKQSLWSLEDQYVGHFRRFNKKQSKRLVDATGLKSVYESYFFSYYYPLVWLLRVLPEKLGRKNDFATLKQKEDAYHKQGKLTKFLLNCLHNIELIFMRIGLKMPFGTSRLIVLEK